MNPELNAALKRLLENARQRSTLDEMRGASSRPVKCAKCKDVGWIEITSGTVETVGDNEHKCSEQNPAVRRCSCRPKRQVEDASGARGFS